jgi:carbon-monoxide dehydrogenase small subunit
VIRVPVRDVDAADVRLNVNGEEVVAAVQPRVTLLDCLRDHLGMTGTHAGCEHGVCGACTVQLDGEPVRACLIYAVMAEGHRITTVEGLQPNQQTLSVLQESFRDAHALQCGYCTPGMLITCTALLAGNPEPSTDEIREALSANLCRCTGYVQIVEAVQLAARRLQLCASGSDA